MKKNFSKMTIYKLFFENHVFFIKKTFFHWNHRYVTWFSCVSEFSIHGKKDTYWNLHWYRKLKFNNFSFSLYVQKKLFLTFSIITICKLLFENHVFFIKNDLFFHLNHRYVIWFSWFSPYVCLISKPVFLSIIHVIFKFFQNIWKSPFVIMS